MKEWSTDCVRAVTKHWVPSQSQLELYAIWLIYLPLLLRKRRGEGKLEKRATGEWIISFSKNNHTGTVDFAFTPVTAWKMVELMAK